METIITENTTKTKLPDSLKHGNKSNRVSS